MEIFQSARLKLTIWYVAIIMVISLSFTLVIYSIIVNELNRIEHMHRKREEEIFNGIMPSPRPLDNKDRTMIRRMIIIDPDLINEAKNRVTILLGIINGGILIVSAAGGYFLAGRTLKPIQDMMQHQKQFIAHASHELKTPLTALRTEIEVALMNKSPSVQELKRVIQSNLEEVVIMQKLAESLLHLTYLESGTPAVKESVHLDEILTASIKRVSALAKQKGIEITYTKNSDVTVLAVKDDLISLFVILLDNAIKYSPSGSKVIISIQKKKNMVAVSVTDNGPGIKESERTRIFDRFYQSESSRHKSHTNGYGLGLSIARQIVQQHNGTIDVRSRNAIHRVSREKGSTFVVRLPGNRT